MSSDRFVKKATFSGRHHFETEDGTNLRKKRTISRLRAEVFDSQLLMINLKISLIEQQTPNTL